jgi:V8-like Glu-specific endopeptidase
MTVTDNPAGFDELDNEETLAATNSSFLLERRIWLGQSEVTDFGVEESETGRWVAYSERLSTDAISPATDSFGPDPAAELAEERDAALDRTEQAATPSRPDHLSLRYRPNMVGHRPTLGEDFDAEARIADRRQPHAWYEPEDRRVFRDTAYPWCTVGRIRGEAKEPYPGSGGTGVLVGPRHVLTAAHVAWYPDGTPNRMRFHPAYFDEASPFGSARVTRIRYFNPKVVRDIDSTNEWNDFALLILDWRIGDVCGWMGSRAFARNWSGLKVWSTIGYPGMFKRTSHVPTFERGFPVTLPSEYDEERATVKHFADCTDGNSGGPIFAYWRFNGVLMPYVVATHSSGPYGIDPYPINASFDNQASAGQRQVNLIIDSRNVYP